MPQHRRPSHQRPATLPARSPASLVALITLVALLLLTSVAGAAAPSIRLVIGQNRAMVDGREQVLDVAPQIINSRTLVPLRFVAEAMGLQVGWDGATRTVTLTGGANGAIRLQIDHPTAQVGATAVTLDAPPTIQNDRTLVPLRFVAEALGLVVGWDGETRTVTISPAAALPPASTVTVNMVHNRFDPPTLTVTPGTTVVWVNGDADDHTVTANDFQFESPNLAPDATFQWTFATPGTYAYYCDLHVGMDGTVIVKDK